LIAGVARSAIAKITLYPLDDIQAPLAFGGNCFFDHQSGGGFA
jgi:hypothetical protein